MHRCHYSDDYDVRKKNRTLLKGNRNKSYSGRMTQRKLSETPFWRKINNPNYEVWVRPWLRRPPRKLSRFPVLRSVAYRSRHTTQPVTWFWRHYVWWRRWYYLRHVVAGIDASAFRINPTQLPFVETEMR